MRARRPPIWQALARIGLAPEGRQALPRSLDHRTAATPRETTGGRLSGSISSAPAQVSSTRGSPEERKRVDGFARPAHLKEGSQVDRPCRSSALRGLGPLALRNIDDLHAAIFGGERVFGVLQVLGAHARSHQPFRADAKLRDQIETHGLRPLL
jgi:hypothetical protein